MNFILHILMTGHIGLAGMCKGLYVVYCMAVAQHLHDGNE